MNIIPLEDFFEAYYQCRKHKRNTYNALSFETNYEHNLVQLCKEVNTKTYEIGRSICFCVTRPKLREVFAADFRDRIIHHVIMMRLEPLFESVFIEDAYNCRKGKGTLYGVLRLKKAIQECSENYTKDCYIGKFDMQGFFMSIHKPTLYRMLEQFILQYYKGDDIDILLYLVKKVVYNKPQYNCIKKSPQSLFDQLGKSKSLFTCGDDYGLPIGNLTSQMFANFYLCGFDIIMRNRFKYYGRYVDDFYIICKDKRMMIDFIKYIKSYLKNELHVTLHPDKIYIQHYTKGVKFTGSVINKDRMYISNRTVGNIINAIDKLNENINEETAYHFIGTMNSYFGFLKHHLTYGIKYRIVKLINFGWSKYVELTKTMSKFSVRDEYNKLYIIKKLLLDNNNKYTIL